MRSVAVALAPRGMTVQALSPGGTDDGVLNGLPPEGCQAVRTWHESGWTPMRHLGTPADVGHAAMPCCRAAAGYSTGQTLPVDGGASLMEPVFPLESSVGEESTAAPQCGLGG